MKRLLNSMEEATNARLKALTAHWGAHTFVKVRLADVLPIERSGVSDSDFRFALQAHFDFLITDNDLQPLFAVEFDGRSHRKPVQGARDQLKTRLCDTFGLPLLRVNARYLGVRENNLDLLGWCIHAWFATKEVRAAYESGHLMTYEEVDPLDLLRLPDSDQPLPLNLSSRARAEIRELACKRRGLDWAPSCFVGEGHDGDICALAWLRVKADSAIWVFTGMQGQSFPMRLKEEAVEHLAVMELRQKLDRFFVGLATPRSIAALQGAITAFKARYQVLGYSGLELPQGEKSA